MTTSNKVLVALLVVASFLLGSLWTKVQYLEEGRGGQSSQGAPGAGGTAAPAKVALKLADLPRVVPEIGIDYDGFRSCLDSGRWAAHVEDDYQSGIRAGIAGTPGNILLDTQTGKTRVVPGAVPFAQVKQAIDELTGEAAALGGEAGATETPNVPVDLVTDADHVRGDRGARIALIEYSDLECPFCTRFHPTAQQVVDEYDGEVMWVYRHFPLDQIHPEADKLAEAVECAGELGGEEKFWELTDRIFAG